MAQRSLPRFLSGSWRRPMASVLHGSAGMHRPRPRAEFQALKESSRALAARYGRTLKTVRKWRNRTTTADAPYGSREVDEHGADAGRGGDRGGVPAEDPAAAGRCPGLLARTRPPHLSLTAPCTDACNATASPGCRSRRPGSSAQTVQDDEIGYVHIDSCELRCNAHGKLVMFLAIDRVSKFAYVELHFSAARWRARPSSATPWRSSPTRSTPVLTEN